MSQTETNARSDSYSSDEKEIARLVDKAKATGQPDRFFGKRAWRRYKLGLRMEVTTGGPSPSDKWAVVMHNISGGGFGFWSKRELKQGTLIFVRQWQETHSGEWVPAYVTHCTVGIQGYLVGARFENPCPPDAQAELDEDEPEHDDFDEPTAAITARRASMRWKCASLGAGSVTAGASITGLAFNGICAGYVPLWLATGLILGICVLGGLAGWAVVGAELQFVNTFRRALRSLTHEEPKLSIVRAAPCRELVALGREFVELSNRWRRRKDDERLQRQQLEELTQMKSNILSIVSHDLRTPLTSILLYAQMLQEELTLLAQEDQRRFLEIIADECNRLSRLVDDLLEVQRLESDRVRWDIRLTDLTGTIRACARVFEAMARSKSIAFSVECPDSLPAAEADADKISQVLSNLLSNALKYTPADGKVHLSAEATGDDILLRVSDTGPGIPRDKWDQLFDRFSQLSDPNVSEIQGFGLGLYIVKRIVERHGGAAWVDSEVGRGSEFFVSIPIRKTTRTPPEGEGEPQMMAGRILVCDPDPQLAALVAQTLRWEKFDVRVCHSGCRLLALLSAGDVDVVVTDVLLPDMNASALMEALDNLSHRSFKLIVHSYAGNGTRMNRRGVDVFLQRPVSREELLQAIAIVMQKRTRPGATVLMVGESSHTAHLKTLLIDAGHVPMAAKNMEIAMTRLRDYSIDVMLIHSSALSADWPELQEIAGFVSRGLQAVILCDGGQRSHRRLAQDMGIQVLSDRAGTETEVLRIVNALTPALLAENA